MFGKPRLGSFKLHNSNFDTSTPQERVVNDRDVNLYYDDDQQVTLVNAFNNNQVTPFANRKPGRNYLAPPARGRFNQPIHVPKKEQSQESNTPNHDSTFKSKKKKKQSKLDK